MIKKQTICTRIGDVYGDVFLTPIGFGVINTAVSGVSSRVSGVSVDLGRSP